MKNRVKKVPNNFKDDPERARKAGQKSRRGISRKESLARMLEMDAPSGFLKTIESQIGKLPGKTMADLLSAVIISEAAQGNIQAHKEINDRVDGKAHQSVEVTGDMSVTFGADEKDF